MKYWWFIIAVLFFIVPIVLNIIIGAPNPLSNIDVVGTEVDWLAFYGAYIGAALSTIIGFITMWQTSRHNALNIMIHKQETYMKELSNFLSLQIAAFDFWNIGNIALYIDNEDLFKNIQPTMNDLNTKAKNILEQYNAWGLLFSETDKAVIKEFNTAYENCVNRYISEIDTLTRKVADLKKYRDFQTFRIWLNTFCQILDNDKQYVSAMFSKGQALMQFENRVLDKLTEENRKTFPKIPKLK